MTEPFGALNAGIKKELKNDGGVLQLYMTDLLRTTVYSNYYGTLTTEAFALKSRVPFQPESYRYQSIRLSYSRSFGRGSQSSSGARSDHGVGSQGRRRDRDERDRIRE
jgi:hypothetical protein